MATVNFKNIETPVATVVQVNNANSTTLTANNPLTITTENYRYKVTLSYVGAGGRNPFTKAAYITVAVYKKNINN